VASRRNSQEAETGSHQSSHQMTAMETVPSQKKQPTKAAQASDSDSSI
jgi:hypothetical protein